MAVIREIKKAKKTKFNCIFNYLQYKNCFGKANKMNVYCNRSLKSVFQNHINDVTLTKHRKRILEDRFLKEVITYETKSKVAEFFYLFFSIFVTIATIILPALLSIQEVSYSDDQQTDKEFKTRIYWSTWVISLLVTISNGLVQFLNLHTQYITFSQTREKLLSIGWSYFELAGPFRNGTHESRFLDFMEAIDMILKNQINQEMKFITGTKEENKNGKNKEPKEDTFTITGNYLENPDVKENLEDTNLDQRARSRIKRKSINQKNIDKQNKRQRDEESGEVRLVITPKNRNEDKHKLSIV